MKNNEQLDSTAHDAPWAFTVPEAEALLHAAWFYEPPCAAYFILRMWAGLRECEVRELDPSDLKSATIGVTNSTKRQVSLAPNVVMMLAILRQEGRLTPESLNPSARVVAAVIKKAGFVRKAESGGVSKNKPVWTNNIMRQTALSYHFAQYTDIYLTCSWAGCNPSLVNHHHRGLINHEDAKRFWEILPT
jgi:hypothetical protein